MCVDHHVPGRKKQLLMKRGSGTASDISWRIGVLYLLGALCWVTNAYLSGWPLHDRVLNSCVVGVTSVLGALLFQLGAISQVWQSSNSNQTHEHMVGNSYYIWTAATGQSRTHHMPYPPNQHTPAPAVDETTAVCVLPASSGDDRSVLGLYREPIITSVSATGTTEGGEDSGAVFSVAALENHGLSSTCSATRVHGGSPVHRHNRTNCTANNLASTSPVLPVCTSLAEQHNRPNKELGLSHTVGHDHEISALLPTLSPTSTHDADSLIGSMAAIEPRSPVSVFSIESALDECKGLLAGADANNSSLVRIRHWCCWKVVGTTIFLAACICGASGVLPVNYSAGDWVYWDVFYWAPFLLGSCLFITSAVISMFMSQPYCWPPPCNQPTWWMCLANVIGSIGFWLCSFFGLIAYSSPRLQRWGVAFSGLWGSACFVAGACLQLHVAGEMHLRNQQQLLQEEEQSALLGSQVHSAME